MNIIAGGLGGGGDVGLSLILLRKLRILEPVIVSFSRCNSARFYRYRVAGSLINPLFYHPRNFEYSLKMHAPGIEVYWICTRDPWGDIGRALDYLVEKYDPRCWISTDIGGDGILSGYESKLGSWRTDTTARAVLAYTWREYGVRGVVAVGGLGLEGGRRKSLDMDELAATLLLHRDSGALIGIYKPDPEDAGIPEKLLTAHDPSGRRLEFITVMLKLYIAAVRGRREIFIDKGYSTGIHRLEWWHPYIFIIDAYKGCINSPLCRSILRGENLGRIKRPPIVPNKRYLKLLDIIRRKGFEQVLRDLIREYRVEELELEHIC